MRHYYVYIMASKSRVLYVGITNDIFRHVWEHRNNVNPGFTSKYRIHRLVYFEIFRYVGNAIAREKRIKGWLREKEVALIRSANPTILARAASKRSALRPVRTLAKSRSFTALRMTKVRR
jgi:putative endonuclease